MSVIVAVILENTAKVHERKATDFKAAQHGFEQITQQLTDNFKNAVHEASQNKSTSPEVKASQSESQG